MVDGCATHRFVTCHEAEEIRFEKQTTAIGAFSIESITTRPYPNPATALHHIRLGSLYRRPACLETASTFPASTGDAANIRQVIVNRWHKGERSFNALPGACDWEYRYIALKSVKLKQPAECPRRLREQTWPNCGCAATAFPFSWHPASAVHHTGMAVVFALLQAAPLSSGPSTELADVALKPLAAKRVRGRMAHSAAWRSAGVPDELD